METDSSKSSDQPKVKSSGRRKVKAASESKGKRSLNLSLPIDDFERLTIHAMKQTNGNLSDLVSRLIRDHLRDFHIARTAKSDSESA